MAIMAIKIGDVVKLNSGGYGMTVVRMQGEEVVTAWQGPNGEHRQSYPAACLFTVVHRLPLDPEQPAGSFVTVGASGATVGVDVESTGGDS